MEFFATWKDAIKIEKADHHHTHHKITPEEWKKMIAERKATFAHMTKEDKMKYAKTVPYLKKMWADCMKKTKGDKKRCQEMEFFASWKDAARIEKADHHKKVDWKKLIAERKATFAHMSKEDKMKYSKYAVPSLKKMWADCMK